MKLEESYAQLVGHPPSEHQRRELYRVRDALGLRDNDALFLVIMALQHYETLYESIPGQIARASEDVTRGPSWLRRFNAVANVAIVMATLCAGAYAIKSHSIGYDSGYKHGYESGVTWSKRTNKQANKLPLRPAPSKTTLEPIALPKIARHVIGSARKPSRAGQ